MTEEQAQRVVRARDFMFDLPAEKFDLRSYVKEFEGFCGTVCCFVGWAPAIWPERFEWYDQPPTLHVRDKEEVRFPVWNVRSIETNLSEWLGITIDEALWITQPKQPGLVEDGLRFNDINVRNKEQLLDGETARPYHIVHRLNYLLEKYGYASFVHHP